MGQKGVIQDGVQDGRRILILNISPSGSVLEWWVWCLYLGFWGHLLDRTRSLDADRFLLRRRAMSGDRLRRLSRDCCWRGFGRPRSRDLLRRRDTGLRERDRDPDRWRYDLTDAPQSYMIIHHSQNSEHWFKLKVKNSGPSMGLIVILILRHEHNCNNDRYPTGPACNPNWHCRSL